MCLLVLAWKTHSRYKLVVAANRDEFHERPAAPLGKWPDSAPILAGRDLRAHGTWLGMDRDRRFGVVTNFRDLAGPRPNAPSRGRLIPEYLGNGTGPGEYLRLLGPAAATYSGFNLLLSDRESLWYASNRHERFARELPPGVYGLSNEFLDSPWPKLRRVRGRFEQWLASDSAEDASPAGLFALLDDRETAAAQEGLPQTGLSAEWERVLSAPFVVHPAYGTRCSTVVLLEPSGALQLMERRFDAQGLATGETEFRLNAGDWA